MQKLYISLPNFSIFLVAKLSFHVIPGNRTLGVSSNIVYTV